MISITHCAAFAAALTFAFPAAGQQAYPTKPVRMLVPLVPGGLTDLMTRVVAQKLRND